MKWTGLDRAELVGGRGGEVGREVGYGGMTEGKEVMQGTVMERVGRD